MADPLQWLEGEALHEVVVRQRMAEARESVWIATANVKAMLLKQGRSWAPVVSLFETLARRRVEVRLLHAEVPSAPFREAFEKSRLLVGGGMELRSCPRVHFKCVLVDGAWLYLGSANLTGAGLGAKSEGKRNFEVGLGTESFELIDRTKALFERVWSGSACATCALHDRCPAPLGPGPKRSTRLGRSRRLAVAGRRPR